MQIWPLTRSLITIQAFFVILSFKERIMNKTKLHKVFQLRLKVPPVIHMPSSRLIKIMPKTFQNSCIRCYSKLKSPNCLRSTYKYQLICIRHYPTLAQFLSSFSTQWISLTKWFKQTYSNKRLKSAVLLLNKCFKFENRKI